MSKSSNPSSASASSTPLLVGACIAWGVATLLFFLLFTAPGDDGSQPGWFLVGISLLEMGAFLLASLLCFRNWRSTQIVSGRNVWFWIGLGLMFYTVGNILFFIWSTIWKLDPAVSLADFFYISSYIFLATGMFKAVLPRRLNLEFSQWLIVVGIGLGGILLTIFVNLTAAEAAVVPPAPAPAFYLAQEAPPAVPEVVPPAVPEPVAEASSAPGWVLQLNNLLEPLEGVIVLLYQIGDVVLLIIAGTLLVAFWGGRYSQSWKLIAIAAFCFYIADMFFAYATNTGTYVEGRLWEVFWTFSAVFFGLGAVVENAVSVNSRRSPRRRRG
ncbi:hypothetical protein [Phormidium tenue]|uniref:Uncharacterized protein n=1 Tax=Phormidium tenue NIES-30 TaxID=549789 RepID=A0A1U7J468_9CYAN|nr:hypothetical protein [Phormidium tenue]MBD2232989.1 hypothetical protein [Phormidium tenue FACHB-1052]OKH47186.1 hypothetical protein NIES30_14555 [Phormidium tenue NIES-30]